MKNKYMKESELADCISQNIDTYWKDVDVLENIAKMATQSNRRELEIKFKKYGSPDTELSITVDLDNLHTIIAKRVNEVDALIRKQITDIGEVNGQITKT